MTGSKASSKTGVTRKGGENPPDPDDSDEVTLDEFCSMNISQKTKLHSTKPELYNQLFNQAVVKKRL